MLACSIEIYRDRPLAGERRSRGNLDGQAALALDLPCAARIMARNSGENGDRAFPSDGKQQLSNEERYRSFISFWYCDAKESRRFISPNSGSA